MKLPPHAMTCALVLGLCWAPASTLAQNTSRPAIEPGARDQARDAIRNADGHLGNQEYDLAIAEIARAYALDPQVDHLYNFAVAYSLKGDRAMAYEYLGKFLDAGSGHRRLVKKARAMADELAKELADERQRQLDELRAAMASAEARHRRELEKARPNATSAPAPASASKPASTGGGSLQRSAGLGLVAAGGLALGAAVAFGVDARSAHRQLDGLGETEEWTVSRDWLYDRGQSSERKMIIFSITGAALATGGAVLYYLGERKARKPAQEGLRVTAAPALGPTSAGMVVSGRF